MTQQSTTLWRHADFLRLWIGQTTSGFGSRFTGLALPFTAITLLAATPLELGLLVAASGLPWLLFGPFIGVWIDRLPRRRILIVADIGRAACLLLIPLLAALGLLRIEALYVVAFLNGLFTAWFETAYQAYLPLLIPRSQLLDGNSKLSVSNSAADVAGPSLAGVLIQSFGAVTTIMLDAASFLVSAICLWFIRAIEPRSEPTTKRSFWRSFREGVTFIWESALLRAFAGTNITCMLGIGMAEAVLLLYLTSSLQLAPATIGLLYGFGSIGGLAGAVVANRISTRWTVGRTIIGASLLRGLGFVGFPLAWFCPAFFIPVLVIASYALHQFGWSIWSVTQATVRQAAAPARLQGRVTAGFLFLVRSATPIGALLGGAMGEVAGILPTLSVATGAVIASSVWLIISPLWGLREPPRMLEESLESS